MLSDQELAELRMTGRETTRVKNQNGQALEAEDEERNTKRERETRWLRPKRRMAAILPRIR